MNLENELRLGNLLLDTKSNQVFEVQFSDLLAMQNGEIDYYEPIKLTKNIIKQNGLLNLKIKGFDLYTRVNDTVYFADFNCNSIDMKFIHDLQNFYFAHKRTELALSLSFLQ